MESTAMAQQRLALASRHLADQLDGMLVTWLADPDPYCTMPHYHAGDETGQCLCLADAIRPLILPSDAFGNGGTVNTKDAE